VANYPDLIYLDDLTKQELVQFLDSEIANHMFERGKWMDDLTEMQHSYWAEPAEGVVTFPFTGASKVVVPLNAIAVEAVHAREMNTFFGSGQLVSAKALNPQWQDARAPVERFLDKELQQNIKVRKPVGDFALERTKFGTGVLKAGYEKIVRTAVRMVDGERKEQEVVVKQGATLDCVPISNFIMPFAFLDEQTSAWCGETHNLTPHEIRIQEESGLYYKGTYDKLFPAINTDGMSNERQFERSQEQLENHAPLLPSKIIFYELWLSWNTDRNEKGDLKEIVVFYHRESRTIMGIRYNWYSDLHRPYRKGVYFPIEHRWYGLGIIKQNNPFQEEVTVRTRQQMDNATLANMRMIKVSRGLNLTPDEPVFPGKLWFLDEMDQVDSIQMGEVYPSSYNTINSAVNWSNQRTGINELTLGQPAVGTPGTASDILSRIQEGNKKFAFLYDNFAVPVQDAITDIAAIVQQFGPRDIEYYDQVEGGDLVKKFFSMPEGLVRSGLLIELRSAGQLNNKLLDRQNVLNVTQTYQQYITAMIQLAEAGQDPQLVQQIMKVGLTGGTELMKFFLQSNDIPNIDRMVLNEQLIGGTNEGTSPPIQSSWSGNNPASSQGYLGQPSQQPPSIPNNGTSMGS